MQQVTKCCARRDSGIILSSQSVSIHAIYHNLSLLLRRFVFCTAEASAKRVTGDEPQGTMGRVQTPVVSFPPSFVRTFSSKERRLGTRQPQPDLLQERFERGW